MQSNDKANPVSAYFNENWQRYQSSIKNNTLYHREMLAALQKFLSEHMGNRAFSFVDVGCGDGSTVAPILAHTGIVKYVGIDAAKDVLKMAAQSLAALPCEKEWMTENMTMAIRRLSSPVDIIFTSYAVHHLSLQDKYNFIENCKQKLKPHGFFLMVDEILKPNQTRHEWLDALEVRIASTIPDMTPDEIKFRMEHPRKDDFPEFMETFANMADQQAWASFQPLVDKGMFAFMVFAK